MVERRVFKNTVFLTAGKGFGDLFTFFFLVVFARLCGQDALGQYAFGMSVGGLASLGMDLGLNVLLVREVSRDRALNARYAGNLLVAKAVLGALLWIIVVAGSLLMPWKHETRALVILLSAYHVLYRLTLVFCAQFRAHEDMHLPALLEIGHKLFVLIAGGTLLAAGADPVTAIAAFPAGALCMCAAAAVLAVSRYGRLDLRPDLAFLRRTFRAAVPFFLLLAVGQVAARGGIIILTACCGETATGIFSAGDRFVVSLSAGLVAFGSALLPALTRASAGSRDYLLQLYERFARVSVAGFLPVSLVAIALSEPIIRVTFGPEFAAAADVLRILTAGLIFSSLNQVVSSLLIVLGRERQLLNVRIGTCSVFLVAGLLLIPRYGPLALAWATLGTQGVTCAACLWCARSVTDGTRVLRTCLAPVASAAFSMLAIWCLSGQSPWVSLSAALATYTASLFALGGFRRHDIVFLKTILAGSRP